MTRYAVVKFLDDDDSPTWGTFSIRHIAHAATYKAACTVRCSEKQAVRDFAGFIGTETKLNMITPERADAWHIDLAARLKPNTVRLRLAVIRAAFEYAIEIDAVLKNPFRHIKPPKYRRAGRVLNDDEISALLEELPELPRRVCIVALYTGMRKQELLALDWSWVRANCVVIPQCRAKSGRERSILLHHKAREALGRPGFGLIFPIKDDALRYHVTRAAKRAGIGRVCLHFFRHTWATRYMELTNDPFGLMAAGGWATALSAEPYQHVNISRQKPLLRLRYRGV